MNFIKKYKLNITVWLLILISVSSFFVYKNRDRVDETIFDANNVYTHIEELTSEKYFGKMAGTQGNELAVEYIQDFFIKNGIQPAGEDGAYSQTFSTIVPIIDNNPVFTIKNSNDETIIDLTMYEDYSIDISYNTRSVDFTGEMILVKDNLMDIDPEMLKDKIVIIEAPYLAPNAVYTALNKGAKGILCTSDPDLIVAKKNKPETVKSLHINNKYDNDFFAGTLSTEKYKEMLDYFVESNDEDNKLYKVIFKNVTIKITIDTSIRQTYNILGKIDGKANNGKILLITADIDGSGEGTNGQYFPGAISQTSGIASLLEVARVLAAQNSTPYETIVFAGWNATLQSFSGSQYYLDNPLYPLEKTKVIHLTSLGAAIEEFVNLSADNLNGKLFRQSFEGYAKDLNVLIQSQPFANGSSAINFKNENVICISLSNSLSAYNNYKDTINSIDPITLENSISVLLNYLKRESYRDNNIDYLETNTQLILLLILLGIIYNYLISRIYKKTPYIKLGKLSAEKIYFSIPVTLMRKFYKYIFPFLIAIFMLVLIANFDSTTNIKEIAGQTQKNFSLYLLLKQSVDFIKNILHFNYGSIAQGTDIWVIVSNAIKSSLKIIVSALLLSVVAGIARGIYEVYTTKKTTLRTLLSLILFSLPDVLVVLLGWSVCFLFTDYFPNLRKIINLSEFIIPLITLSLIPAIYISRITFVTIQDELRKEYIKNARAKGFSKFKIFTYELFPAVLFKIMDTMPTIMTMIISNLIIVVYFFNYTGVISYLLYFNNIGIPHGFFIMASILGIMYLIFTWGIKLIARIVNPLKREVKA